MSPGLAHAYLTGISFEVSEMVINDDTVSGVDVRVLLH